MPDLRIYFEKPGFFLADARLTILLDGQPVYDGSFKAGVDLTVPAAPGPHRLETRIEMPPLTRSRAYELTLDGAPTTATLEYSRFWGNFKKRLPQS